MLLLVIGKREDNRINFNKLIVQAAVRILFKQLSHNIIKQTL